MMITMKDNGKKESLIGGTLAVLALAGALAFAFTYSPKAHAISEAYRKQLESQHKTQVQDANGYQPEAAPATHFKAVHAKKYGVDFKRGKDGIAYLDGKACATDEVNEDASAYACGVYTVIVRATGRIDLMQDNRFKGHMN